jgi:hypothetical protein
VKSPSIRGLGAAFQGACVTDGRQSCLPTGRAQEPNLPVKGILEGKGEERGIESDNRENGKLSHGREEELGEMEGQLVEEEVRERKNFERQRESKKENE